ncbi:Protein of unknown function [Gryllus bimaculatus]|nr:Protein of unknown function [Gryllus bimaculatus]
MSDGMKSGPRLKRPYQKPATLGTFPRKPVFKNVNVSKGNATAIDSHGGQITRGDPEGGGTEQSEQSPAASHDFAVRAGSDVVRLNETTASDLKGGGTEQLEKLASESHDSAVRAGDAVRQNQTTASDPEGGGAEQSATASHDVAVRAGHEVVGPNETTSSDPEGGGAEESETLASGSHDSAVRAADGAIRPNETTNTNPMGDDAAQSEQSETASHDLAVRAGRDVVRLNDTTRSDPEGGAAEPSEKLTFESHDSAIQPNQTTNSNPEDGGAVQSASASHDLAVRAGRDVVRPNQTTSSDPEGGAARRSESLTAVPAGNTPTSHDAASVHHARVSGQAVHAAARAHDDHHALANMARAAIAAAHVPRRRCFSSATATGGAGGGVVAVDVERGHDARAGAGEVQAHDEHHRDLAAARAHVEHYASELAHDDHHTAVNSPFGDPVPPLPPAPYTLLGAAAVAADAFVAKRGDASVAPAGALAAAVADKGASGSQRAANSTTAPHAG